MEYALTATKTEAPAGSYYDKIARLYDLTFKLNGYGRSLDQYFARYPLPVRRGSRILDAGCGTGLLTLALLRNIRFPVEIIALDLSATSIVEAKKAVLQNDGRQPSMIRKSEVNFTQGNVLSLPFSDDLFDLVVTSGALEYVPLQEGLTELARVIRPEGHLLHLPCRPSPASTVLEILFRFKSYSPSEVHRNTLRHFRVVHHYRFAPHEIIGWSKTAIMAQKT